MDNEDDNEGGNSNEENVNNEDETENDEDVPEEVSKTRSIYWSHFVGALDESGQRFAQCKYCTKKYLISGKSNGGTGNLSRHLIKKHSNLILLENVVEQDEEFVFSQEKFRAALLKWVVMCDQAFTAPQQEAFVELIHTLNPKARTYSDKTIKADELADYLTKFDQLKSVIAKIPDRISLTMDGWTSKNSLSFLAIRGHWLDDDWKYQSKLLDFAYVEGEHTGYKQSVILEDCLIRLAIPFSKIIAITLDNASNNDTLFDWLADHGILPATHQIRCMAHILNLAVQDILSLLKVPDNYNFDPDFDVDANLDYEVLEDIDVNEELINNEAEDEMDLNDTPIIVKLRKLVKKIRKSVQMRQKLKKLCDTYGMKYLVPIIDVTTRWNSSYHMILRAEKLAAPLQALCLKETPLNAFRITTRDWTELLTIKDLLVHFDRATKLMSMERHSTNSAYLPSLNWLMEVLTDYTDDNTSSLAVAVKAGLTKLKKYELLINDSKLPFICTFLNRALKINYFKEYYNRNAAREILTTISTYFTASYTSTSQNSKRKANDLDSNDDIDQFHAHMYKRSRLMNEPKELKTYLDLPLTDPKGDEVEYWKSKQKELPCLSAMARDFLPIQPSSVSVERNFSEAVDVVTPNRCRLHQDTIRAIMCLKSWYKT